MLVTLEQAKLALNKRQALRGIRSSARDRRSFHTCPKCGSGESSLIRLFQKISLYKNNKLVKTEYKIIRGSDCTTCIKCGFTKGVRK